MVGHFLPPVSSTSPPAAASSWNHNHYPRSKGDSSWFKVVVAFGLVFNVVVLLVLSERCVLSGTPGILLGEEVSPVRTTTWSPSSLVGAALLNATTINSTSITHPKSPNITQNTTTINAETPPCNKSQPMDPPTNITKVLEEPHGPKTSFEPIVTPPEECQGAPSETKDPFPPDFELSVYETRNRDSVPVDTVLDQSHYELFGKSQGWTSTSGQSISTFINSLVSTLTLPALEMGPFTKPQLQGTKVKYFDVLDKAGLVERAKRIGYPIRNAVEIDFVNPSGDLNSIEEASQFSMVFSSHCVEHQLDLVRHFQAVSRILVDGGYYVLLVSGLHGEESCLFVLVTAHLNGSDLVQVPDKRACFDHFIAPSTMAQVLDDFYNERYFDKSHTLRSVLEHRAHTAHGNFWSSPLPPRPESDPAGFVNRLRGAIQEFKDAALSGSYLDTHNYYFTPESMSEIVQFLHELKLINLSVHRVYPTVKGSVEFGIVLKNNKCRGPLHLS